MTGAGARASLVAAVLLVATGCTSRAAPASPRPAGPPARALHASVAQFRFDEGTTHLRAGITNQSSRDVVVGPATIRWGGLAFTTAHLPHTPVRPTQTAAFTVDYAAAHCARAGALAAPVLVAVVDGSRRQLPLTVDSPGLLDRLRSAACGRQALDRAVDVRLHLAARPEGGGGRRYLPGFVVLDRRGHGRPAVRLSDVEGSVLLVFRARHDLPVTLGPDTARLAVPIRLGSTHRCDAHALSQSSQTFLISAFVSVGRSTAQRVVLPLRPSRQDQLQRLVRHVCRAD